RRVLADEMAINSSWQFVRDVVRLIWEYRWFSLAIFLVTIVQEFAALWPVSLLGQFIDRLTEGDPAGVIWLLILASFLYPGLVRANVVLRHKLFYETDFRKMVELVLKVSDRGEYQDTESAAAAYTRAANAVSGITNAAYHVLGSFTPVIIKIAIVSASLLAYNRSLGLVYLASLLIPAVMTVVFNRRLRVLLDSQYSVVSRTSGAGIKTISDRDNLTARDKFREALQVRRGIYISLVSKSQFYLYAREAVLVGSQFLVVLIALGMRQELGMTPGDFAKIIGYMAQVAAAFLNAAACLDAIVSYSRAYHIYATVGKD
ncbi:MAG: ABC transporter ATP-binding protein, partial [Anaerolineae bacterium]|nr:ABC transporter ATP-binding protein [Anaerolineae bacterium]